MNDFKEIRNHLINMLEDLDERLVNITDEANSPDELITQAFEDDEVFDSFEHTCIQEMEKIKQAISGIDNETYGICSTCGLEIKKEQLNKNPFSRQCIHCAEEKNDS